MISGKKLLTIIITGAIVMGLFGCSSKTTDTDKKDEKAQPITSFTYSSGGGMSGGGESLKIYTKDDTTYMSIASTEWWYEDDEVTEYIVDREVLDEIEDIFKKNGMKSWHNKEFTNMFVADGPSYSYSFQFGRVDTIHFSSQIYPEKYRKKLDPIHDVINEARKTAKLLPGLVTVEKSPEELRYRENPDNGKVEIEVYKYQEGKVYYCVMNGTKEDVSLSPETIITNVDTKEEVFKKVIDFEREVCGNDFLSDTVSPAKWLEPGNYCLSIGEYSYYFEIAFPVVE